MWPVWHLTLGTGFVLGRMVVRARDFLSCTGTSPALLYLVLRACDSGDYHLFVTPLIMKVSCRRGCAVRRFLRWHM